MQEYGPATETPELRCAFPVTVATEGLDRSTKVSTCASRIYWSVLLGSCGFLDVWGVCKDEIWDCLFDPQNPAAGILEP